MPQYSVNNLTVDNVLGYIKNKEISIPEIQRPFVWKSDQIRDLIDSLYNGYPIGYLIIWQNPDTVDKNGEKTIGKKIMIDGQQRITALMTSIVGLPVIDKDFKEKVRCISFNPYAAAKGEPCFEVQSAAILKDKKWVKENVAVGKKAPKVYLGEVVSAIEAGKDSPYTTMRTMDELYANLDENCIPREIINMDVTDYHTFLEARRKLMAQKVKAYFNAL